MQMIEYFGCSQLEQQHWLEKIKQSDWEAGQLLYKLLDENKLKDFVGKDPKVWMLTDGDELISFCTYSEWDDVQPTVLTPWIGFVYTFPQYRGHRYVGELIRHAEALAKADGVSCVHISTGHTGLYEKYGYEFFQMMKNIHGEDSRIYVKHL